MTADDGRMVRYCNRCGCPQSPAIGYCEDCGSPEFSCRPHITYEGWT